eukprot:CAMPEP_0116153784 /NCGR_PEP_ID=MMETSP0329-20121206/21429_1 /TAXON_ID=697910 /ORGANISM="Pseudo-nitzschia arenysensis, Strain B593" /LENGTH=131 /DNA_ID=CAMNT_0003650715 /DNA_START=79 /DNA_END=474 /DNA_ORIENTATION=-
MPNPVALPKPKEGDNNDAKPKQPTIQFYQGNIQLLEARYLQLCSSIRALWKSVEELRAFCKNPETQDQADLVIVEAIFENLEFLRKQRKELASVVQEMKQLRADTEVPDDIRIMVLGDENEQDEGDDGVYL